MGKIRVQDGGVENSWLVKCGIRVFHSSPTNLNSTSFPHILRSVTLTAPAPCIIPYPDVVARVFIEVWTPLFSSQNFQLSLNSIPCLLECSGGNQIIDLWPEIRT